MHPDEPPVPEATPEPPRAVTLASRATRAFGAAVLVAAAWSAAGLLAELPRYAASTSYWLEAGSRLPVWLTCLAGGEIGRAHV